MPINLEKAIRARDFAGLRDAFDDLPPSELAQLIQDLPIEQQTTIFRILPLGAEPRE
jgi:Mg/Co/Ni transporter MgtE